MQARVVEEWCRSCGTTRVGVCGEHREALVGRPWRQAEVFGLAPDPTALATLGLLLLLLPSRCSRWLLWPIPLLWCSISGMTLATMGAREAWLMPLAALLAVAIATFRRE